jgi:DNA-binding MarR family transcriptional regulator
MLAGMSPGKPQQPSRQGAAAARGDASRSLRGCTCFRLRRLTRRVTAVYNHALAPTGMRVTQYSLLSNLRRSGPLPLSLLAEALDMDRTTLSRNLKPLTEAGWVAIRGSPDDARVRLVALTTKGEAHLQAARAHWKRAQEEVSATIGAEELGQLHDMLDRYVPLFRPAPGNEGDIE